MASISQRARLSDWLVVGGGPCGVLAAGAILDSLPSDGSVIWADAGSFSNLGRFGIYRKVPGNTPVGHLTDAFSAVASLSFNEDQHQRRSLTAAPVLIDMDRTKTCPLAPVIDALLDASDRVRRDGRVLALENTSVDSLVFNGVSWDAFSKDVRGCSFDYGVE